jgi:hypothetical protein
MKRIISMVVIVVSVMIISSNASASFTDLLRMGGDMTKKMSDAFANEVDKKDKNEAPKQKKAKTHKKGKKAIEKKKEMAQK